MMESTEDISFKLNKADYILAFAASVQSLLVVAQSFMIDVLYVPKEVSTMYRVLFTALPIISSIPIVLRRKLSTAFVAYFIVSLLLCWSMILTPRVEFVVYTEGFRFLLPVVIPTFLCCISIRKLEVFEQVIYYISWMTVCVAYLYVAYYFMGRFVIDSYNMSFSYGLLIPVIVFYSRNSNINKVISVSLIILIIAIGSRGAAYVSLLYIFIYHMSRGDKAIVYRLAVLVTIGFVLLNTSLLAGLEQQLEQYGIESRTLSLVVSGQADFDSGRNEIYDAAKSLIIQRPVFGYGMYSDRVFLEITYVHNILLEIFMNFGLVVGLIVVAFAVVRLLNLYLKLDRELRLVLLKYLIATITPLMVSNSYLKDYSFAMFLGLCVLLRQEMQRRVIRECAR